MSNSQITERRRKIRSIHPRSKIRRKQRKKKVPGQRSEETQKKKESSRSKIKREQKIQKGVWTRQCMNKHAGLSQARKKRKEAMAYDTWGGPLLDYQPKSFVPVTLSPYAKQKQKRKRPKYQSQVSPPKTTTTTTTPYPTRWGRLHGSTSAIMFYQVPYFYPNH